MPAPDLFGFGLVLLAGVMNGTFAVPTKWMHPWAWENTWLAWAILTLVVLPGLVTFTTVPAAWNAYDAAAWPSLAAVIACGAAWGASHVMFGLGLARAGVAIGFAIVVGLAAAMGSIVPLLLSRSGDSRMSVALITGVLIVLAGVSLCSLAGSRKELNPTARLARPQSAGILLCIGAGIGGSMINIGMVAGAPLADNAARHGAGPVYRTNVIWMPLLLAGFIAIAAYCIRLLIRNGTWKRFTEATARHWLLALLMAVCWFGSVELYGGAAIRLGRYGPVFGWPMFLSTSIITANIWGLATGEWREASAGARRLMFAGVTILIAAIFFIGIAGRA